MDIQIALEKSLQRDTVIFFMGKLRVKILMYQVVKNLLKILICRLVKQLFYQSL